MARILAPAADHVVATASVHAQATPAARTASLAAAALGERVQVVDTVPDAVAAARDLARPEDLICVTGSIYTIAEVPR
jgi:dihydrofolate synthase/folylpolyglutamate synthase